MAAVGDLLRVKTVDAEGAVREIEGITPHAWTSLMLQNGWVDLAAGFETAQYRRTADGDVEIRGVIKSGVVTNGTVIFTLPEGYRPVSRRINATVYGAGEVSGRIDVWANGQATIHGVLANDYLVLNMRFSLQ